MSSITTSQIYTGTWMNHSYGTFRGSTITLSSHDGNLFIAFLGIFFTLIGSQMWKILMFVFHQTRANNKTPKDGLYFQQQNILRNTPNPAGAAWQFFMLLRPWWGRAKWSVARTLPLGMLGIAHLSLFAVAGVFSSKLVGAAGGDMRLVARSESCGSWDYYDDTPRNGPLDWQKRTLNDTLSAERYARACYGDEGIPLECGLYVVKQVAYTATAQEECPFSGGICLSNGTTAYRMDTGWMDSHETFGINAPAEERVRFRKLTTCAPLKTESYTSQSKPNDNDYSWDADDDITQFNYGRRPPQEGTFRYNPYDTIGGFGYTLDVVEKLVTGDDDWYPIPELTRTDADVSLIIIYPNGIEYLGPIDDPVFGTGDWYMNNDERHYEPLREGSPIACAEQYEACNPSNDLCTGLLPFFLARDALNSLDLSPQQGATADRIMVPAMYSSMYSSVYGRSQSAIKAQDTVMEWWGIPLPKTQWMIELSSWFSLSLARFQRHTAEYATGPTSGSNRPDIVKPQNSTWEDMCEMQMVAYTEGTISFSVFGIVIILVVGCTVIITSFTLEYVVEYVQLRFHKGASARLCWILDDKLQLQRMALEAAGKGSFAGIKATVPVTASGEMLEGWEEDDFKDLNLGGAPTAPSDGRGMLGGDFEMRRLMGGGEVVR